ncbi:hypothetical protein SeLEV6574_g00492 [Synchytrium endobioticum]|uniref:Uncharacterized protein n=1 Tax=Synchytrium endobioticum TaxID=286115 RepID=A0A507DHD1_9FUNG|nr:hypothetical protein SeLEV6574_g00492 [Synchytrium endobioticum]
MKTRSALSSKSTPGTDASLITTSCAELPPLSVDWTVSLLQKQARILSDLSRLTCNDEVPELHLIFWRRDPTKKSKELKHRRKPILVRPRPTEAQENLSYAKQPPKRRKGADGLKTQEQVVESTSDLHQEDKGSRVTSSSHDDNMTRALSEAGRKTTVSYLASSHSTSNAAPPQPHTSPPPTQESESQINWEKFVECLTRRAASSDMYAVGEAKALQLEEASGRVFGNPWAYMSQWEVQQVESVIPNMLSDFQNTIHRNLELILDLPIHKLPQHVVLDTCAEFVDDVHAGQSKLYQSPILARALYNLFRERDMNGHASLAEKWKWSAYPLTSVACAIAQLTCAVLQTSGSTFDPDAVRMNHQKALADLRALEKQNPTVLAEALDYLWAFHPLLPGLASASSSSAAHMSMEMRSD